MTVIGINGSPRSNFNTAQLIQKALEGASSNGYITELINLGDLNFKPCSSCFMCKKSQKHEGHCYQKDDLLPVLEKIKNAKAVILGSPVYFHDVSGLFHSFAERLLFSNCSYRDLAMVFGRSIKSGMILDMGSTTEEAKETNYDKLYEHVKYEFASLFGSCEILPIYDTTDVNDYSKFCMPSVDAEHKARIKKEQFPEDLRKAFELGKMITSN